MEDNNSPENESLSNKAFVYTSPPFVVAANLPYRLEQKWASGTAMFKLRNDAHGIASFPNGLWEGMSCTSCVIRSTAQLNRGAGESARLEKSSSLAGAASLAFFQKGSPAQWRGQQFPEAENESLFNKSFCLHLPAFCCGG
ncbi:hypothetical protein CEXT_654631 [Caerostris extrusa]|uniref:Uncharacterized protein n=1 Tax=Caerostris extrusa TaxID=172846 RepID=A0AAV4PHW7_CAEEX|nr:hypothetical protein CEXT_654631 [Caerostris extrusa]